MGEHWDEFKDGMREARIWTKATFFSFIIGTDYTSALIWKGISKLRKDPEMFDTRIQIPAKYGARSLYRESEKSSSMDIAPALVSIISGGVPGFLCGLPLTPLIFTAELAYNWKKGNLTPPTVLEETAERETRETTDPKIDPETDVFMQYAT
ncbi:MAG: hypothetical protein KAT43_04895 [Nanoarchaeota archaeon]|nr:hypothetical protein [Nanoarchaeota archaeon]